MMKFKELFLKFKKLPMWLKSGVVFGTSAFLLAILSYFRIIFFLLGSFFEILFLIILIIPLILLDLIEDAFFYGWVDLPRFPTGLFFKNEWGTPTFFGIILYVLLWFFIGALIGILIPFISKIIKRKKVN